MVKIEFVVFLLISIIVYLIARCLNYWKNKSVNVIREIVMIMFFIYFLGVIYVTFFPFIIFVGQLHHGHINLVPFKSSLMVLYNDRSIGLTNILGNVALLYPLGIFIPFLYKNGESFKSVLKYGVISTLTIEVIQYFVTSRIADIDDVIFNIIGCLLGYISYKGIKVVLSKFKAYEEIRSINKNIIANMIFFIIPIMIVFSGYCMFQEKRYYIDNTLSKEEVKQAINSKPVERYIEIGTSKITLTKQLYGVELTSYIKESNERYKTEGILNQYKDIGFYKIEDDNTNKLIIFGQNSEKSSNLKIKYSKEVDLEIKNQDIFLFVLDAEEDEDVGSIKFDFVK